MNKTLKNNKTLIGFAGRKRAGKGVLANMLKNEYGAKIITVADYLKHLCCELLNMDYENLILMKDNGSVLNCSPTEKWFKIINKRTGISIENIKSIIDGKIIYDVREMLQVIGTDLIRKFRPNWHVEQMIEDIKSYSNETIIAVDDVRFPNEREAIEQLGGTVFFITRPSFLDVSNHISEISLFWQDFDNDKVIINDKGISDLETYFKVKYANNFDVILPKSCFLNENIEYKNDFKLNIKEIILKENNPLVIETLKQYL